ncbi:hypothetical protein GNI_073480 [Gregarina niphandrodes]|uniref:Uncharacterized protein n=1 Tax=Gregarina niphandrodes TaxID=110365 RepID=A0A023B736_GRENI|nr:hypothetical protein GNI_073480 [Gregarina niphandrodes]EZG66950.1 hypothetical protein GNI_073480 [Gregarina niphandrodes]|eukprot:XP_011130409.1 hypothetical protein GNI_073480 [Gregarina niphandrodes]
MSINLGYRPTVEDICKLHPDLENLVKDVDRRFAAEAQKLNKVKELYQEVTSLNAGSRGQLDLKAADSQHVRRVTRGPEDTMEIIDSSLVRLQRIVDCLQNDFDRLDNGMLVSTQVEHLEYLDDLQLKTELLESRVQEAKDRLRLASFDESRLIQWACDQVRAHETRINGLH